MAKKVFFLNNKVWILKSKKNYFAINKFTNKETGTIFIVRTQWHAQGCNMLIYLLRGWKKVKAGLFNFNFKGGDTLPHDFRRVLFTCQKVADG